MADCWYLLISKIECNRQRTSKGFLVDRRYVVKSILNGLLIKIFNLNRPVISILGQGRFESHGSILLDRLVAVERQNDFFGVGRIMRDCTNPFDRYSEADFILRFRFSKEGEQVVFDAPGKGRVKNSLHGEQDLDYCMGRCTSCTASCRSPLDNILSYLSQ